MIDARDVGEVAAQIAAAPAGPAGATYWPTGPGLITYADVAATLSELHGRNISFRETTAEQDVAAMVNAGIPPLIAAMNAQAFALTAEGDAEWLSEDVASIIGRPARTFAQFAADHAMRFDPKR